MKLVEKTLVDFIDEVDSDSPAPGGGSVAAAVGALGAGLSRMVGHLTINKKKFRELDEGIKEEFLEKFDELCCIKEELVLLVDRDTEAFNQVMESFKMPKETDEQKEKRKDAIEQATYKAIDVPMVIAELSYRGLELIEGLGEEGNQSAITDLGVSVLLLASGLEGAILNVKINLGGISDNDYVKETRDRCNEILHRGLEIKQRVIKEVEGKL